MNCRASARTTRLRRGLTRAQRGTTCSNTGGTPGAGEPAELPAQRQTLCELVLNPKTAMAPGRKTLQTSLVRADRVIE